MRRNMLIFLFIVVLLIGCKNTTGMSKGYIDISGMDYSDIYTLALEAILEEDLALNYEMQYIAINTKTLLNASQNDVEEIMAYFTKFNIDIIDESYETLKDKDMVVQSNIEGVLLEVTRVEVISDTKVKVECTKFRSGDGAIWIEYTIVDEEGIWKIDEITMTAIS
ncbi:MAG: hypothetical protein PF505_09590 [Vallitaleaceae bacterium]|jgi:hypothetical protein|nr:hypothetical protein [Vallitaleaceae bacterium]